MNRKFPLSTLQAPSGLHVIVTAQGNHFAQTHDPAAAALIQSAPDLLGALRVIAKQSRNAAETFPNAPGRGDFLQIAAIAESLLAKSESRPAVIA